MKVFTAGNSEWHVYKDTEENLFNLKENDYFFYNDTFYHIFRKKSTVIVHNWNKNKFEEFATDVLIDRARFEFLDK